MVGPVADYMWRIVRAGDWSSSGLHVEDCEGW